MTIARMALAISLFGFLNPALPAFEHKLALETEGDERAEDQLAREGRAKPLTGRQKDGVFKAKAKARVEAGVGTGKKNPRSAAAKAAVALQKGHKDRDE